MTKQYKDFGQLGQETLVAVLSGYQGPDEEIMAKFIVEPKALQALEELRLRAIKQKLATNTFDVDGDIVKFADVMQKLTFQIGVYTYLIDLHKTNLAALQAAIK